MPNAVVVYKSKYGSTKKYAEWIAKALGADLFDASDINADALQNYDTIIYGGGLYAGGILGLSFIKKAFDKIKNKKIVLFTVGLADPKDKAQFKPIIEKNLTSEMQDCIKIFHLRGAIDYKKINPAYRAAMSLIKRQVERKGEKGRSDEDRLFLETYSKTADFTDETSIAPLVDYVKHNE